MKKFLAALLILVLAMTGMTLATAEGVMSYADYAAAAIDDEVVIECYVQAHQSWWNDKVTVYAADQDGAYFLYEMACSQEDAAKLVPGAKIKVTGYKGEWAGEVEVMDATFEFVEGEAFVAEAKDLTAVLATERSFSFSPLPMYWATRMLAPAPRPINTLMRISTGCPLVPSAASEADPQKLPMTSVSAV